MDAIPFTSFSDNEYLTYPHANGFADGGAALVTGRIGGETVSLVKRHLVTGEMTPLAAFPHPTSADKRIWFEVATETNTLMVISGGFAWLLDLNTVAKPQKCFTPPEGEVLEGWMGLRHDGAAAVLLTKRGNRHTLWLLSLPSGHSEALMSVDWQLNHAHFCRHDPSWIGFSHEGATETILDRMWAWHRTLAPQGKCVFDQRSSDPTQPLCVGHERWCAHDTSALVIAYGVSPCGPRGLYEVFVDGRPPRLVSEGDRDWHCSSTRDGRLAVVDTTGPHDLPGRGWDGVRGESDILLVDMATGARTLLARTRSGPGQGHPHPVFSPNADFIYFNESDATGDHHRVMRVPVPVQ